MCFHRAYLHVDPSPTSLKIPVENVDFTSNTSRTPRPRLPEMMAFTTISAPMADSKRKDSTIFFSDGCLMVIWLLGAFLTQ